MPVANATLIVGPEATTDNVSNNPIDMADEILELEPDQAPFVTLLKRLRKVKSTNPKFQWQEGLSMPWLTTLSASATNVATALGVTQDIFRVGDVVRITTTGEAILVTATATGAITATRGLGSGTGSAAGAIAAVSAANASELFIVGNANAEGATLREIKHPQLNAQFNYTEIFRTPFGVTGTEDATEHYGGDERARLRAKFGLEHVRNIERSFWFGARDIKNVNQRTTGGVVEFLASNVTPAVGTLTEAAWKTFLKQGFRYGSARKVLFASPTVKVAIDGFPLSAARMNDPGSGNNKWGIDVVTYYSSQGVVDVVMHRSWNDSATYGGFAFLIDPDNVAYHYLEGRDTMLRPNVQAPDYDGFKDEYLTECGLSLANEATHAMLKGVTG
jgi:Family of unknown function (DUF5309)